MKFLQAPSVKPAMWRLDSEFGVSSFSHCELQGLSCYREEARFVLGKNYLPGILFAFVVTVLQGVFPLFVLSAYGDESVVKQGDFELRIGRNTFLRTTVLDIGNVRPGAIIESTVELFNDLDSDVTFNSVHAGCKCTTATVPQMDLAPEKSVKSLYRFATPKTPRELSDEYSVFIECEKGRGMLRLLFRAKFDGLVAFSRPENHVPFTNDTEIVSFRIPLTVASEDLLTDVVFEIGKELHFLTHKLVYVEAKPFLECTFSPLSVTEQLARGELLLRTTSGFQSTTLCTLSKEAAVEILPSRVIFTFGKTKDGLWQATALLKIRRVADSKANVALRSIACETEKSVVLETSFVKMSDELYRVSVTPKSASDLEKKQLLQWSIELDNGGSITLETESVLSN